ncbi:MAG: bifunctional nuclease family protein [Armatimonadetes bacterium]|nr:bifunctional nuclease family protein [Armatimonadota bacterium]
MIRVQHVRISEDHMGNPVLLLSDPETGLELPIWIGEYEAFAIQRELQGTQLPRPMTHDLMRNILVELGVELMRVEINELYDNTYYATLVLRWKGKTFFVDARPSDSVALAVRMKAPIYVAEEVARIAGHLPQPSRKEIERFMRLIKDVELPEM